MTSLPKSRNTSITSAFYMLLSQARRSFRALRGLVRLQGVVRGQNVRRQTMNAMKQMQLLVRVQSQIQTRRIQMLENQALQHQAYRNDKEVESTLSKWMSNQVSFYSKIFPMLSTFCHFMSTSCITLKELGNYIYSFY